MYYSIIMWPRRGVLVGPYATMDNQQAPRRGHIDEFIAFKNFWL